MTPFTVKMLGYARAYVYQGDSTVLYMERSVFTGRWRAYSRISHDSRRFGLPSFQTERKTAKAAARAALAYFATNQEG